MTFIPYSLIAITDGWFVNHYPRIPRHDPSNHLALQVQKNITKFFNQSGYGIAMGHGPRRHLIPWHRIASMESQVTAVVCTVSMASAVRKQPGRAMGALAGLGPNGPAGPKDLISSDLNWWSDRSNFRGNFRGKRMRQRNGYWWILWFVLFHEIVEIADLWNIACWNHEKKTTIFWKVAWKLLLLKSNMKLD